MFDWRAHIGRGEGAAAFGAGTYLSTANSVHNHYKQMFTASLMKNNPERAKARQAVYDAMELLAYEEIPADKSFSVKLPEFGLYTTRPVFFPSESAAREFLAQEKIRYKEQMDKIAATPHRGVSDESWKYFKRMSDAIDAGIEVRDLIKENAAAEEKVRLAQEALAAIERKSTPSPTYHVAVDIHPDNLLDWDAPLNQQSEAVRNALKGMVAELAKREGGRLHTELLKKKYDNFASGKISGGNLYNELANKLGSQAAASEALQKEGVLGHVYNASGGKESQFRNYVVYDDSKIHTFYVERSDLGIGVSTITDEQRAAVKEHIEKVLGPKVNTLFRKMFHSGEYTQSVKNGVTEDWISISVHAIDPMSIAFHESMHAFISHLEDMGLHDVAKSLYKAADSIVVRNQLEKLLANEPAALAQIRNSMDERVAYMYQFWAAGKLNVGDGAKNIFTKIRDFIYKALGIWTNDQRAVHIMEYFNSGEYGKNVGQRSVVAKVLLEQGTNKTFETIKKNLEPLANVAARIASPGDVVLRDMKNPAITEIVDAIISPTSSTHSDPGFINAQRTKWKAVMNGMLSEISRVGKVTSEHMNEALEALQRGERAQSTEARNIQHIVRRTLDNMFDYMRNNGVEVKDLGYGKDYFPRVYDVDYITKNKQAFLDMLEPHVRAGNVKGSAKEILNSIIRNDGSDFGIVSMKPGMQALKERALKDIPHKDLAPFMQKDLLHTMNSYIMQATRRAEWSKRFGDDNKVLKHLLAATGVKIVYL